MIKKEIDSENKFPCKSLRCKWSCKFLKSDHACKFLRSNWSGKRCAHSKVEKANGHANL